MDETRDLRHHLKRLTTEAYRRCVPQRRHEDSPLTGDLYYLDACPEPGIEWVVTDVEASASEAFVVPADSLSWIGSADVAVRETSSLGPLVLRCGYGVWLSRRVLTPEQRTGTLSEADLKRACASLRRSSTEPSSAEQEVDFAAEYLAWRRTLEAAGKALSQVCPNCHSDFTDQEESLDGEVVPMPKSKKVHDFQNLLAIAASIVLTISSGAFFLSQGSRFAELKADIEVERKPQAAVFWALEPLGNTLR